MEPLPEITSLECIAALVDLAFVIARVAPERVTLVRDGRTVVVPRHRTLGPSDVSVLLFLARVDEDEFVAALAQRRRPSGERLAVAPRRGEAPAEAPSGVRRRPSEIEAEPRRSRAKR